MNFEINDKVLWASQSGGYSKVKIGTVVAIVPPLAYVSGIIRPSLNPGNHPKERKYREAFDGGSLPRDHKSYVILVEPKSSKGKAILYWPRVSHLCLLKWK